MDEFAANRAAAKALLSGPDFAPTTALYRTGPCVSRGVQSMQLRLFGVLESMKNGITNSMKTAISVEDSLMNEADDAARDLGLSRSGLIAEALREYLRRRRQARVSEQLNQVYADGPNPDERQLVRKLKTELPVPDRW